jgi:hypothetical protein
MKSIKYDKAKDQLGLLDLPVEILLAILEPLDYPTAIKASAVCRVFRDMIQLKTRFTKDDKLAYMLHVEHSFPRYLHPEHFACSKCLRLFPEAFFGYSQVTSSRGKHRQHANRRFCLRCGITRFHYRPTQEIRVFVDDLVERRGTLRICGHCRNPCLVGMVDFLRWDLPNGRGPCRESFPIFPTVCEPGMLM